MNLMHRWMQKLYWNSDAFKDSTNFEHIKTHYYWSHASVSLILHLMTLHGLFTCSTDQPHEGRPRWACPQCDPLVKQNDRVFNFGAQCHTITILNNSLICLWLEFLRKNC